MKCTRDGYIKDNIKLSLSNTDKILNSIDTNLNSILGITSQIQTCDNSMDAMIGLVKIKEMSLESVLEKCNMLKAALDRFTICSEDITLPTRRKYINMRLRHRKIRPGRSEATRFRRKLSKSNMPPMMISPPIFDEEFDDYE
jgi:hypothetical protein